MGVINCLNVYKSSFGYRDVRSHQFVVSSPSDPVNTIHLSRVPHILPSINHPLKIQHIPSSPTIHCSFFVDTCTSITMSSRDSSSSKGVPSNLVAFPSVSSALNSLPQATSIHNVSLHPNMYAQRAAESEAKLQKALSKTPSSFTPQTQPLVYGKMPSSTTPQDSSSPLMMRTKSKFSTS
ncbi:hypothetical protein BJ165DRAFT_1480677 [Panaeolus papilionaceus]|nr:hypothetical protein BJ165DRAFT_1480677 [Panaeolus papilionaceus]